MIVLPLDRPINWKKPPTVVILLVLINTFIYYGLQSGDDAIEQKATKFYFDSGLAKLEIPAYRSFLMETGNFQGLMDFEKLVGSEENTSSKGMAYYAPLLININYAYHQAIQAESLPGSTHATSINIKKKRELYLQKLEHSIIHNYSLRPAQPTLGSLFGHMFLHGSTGHLLGNMIFLFIVGFVVEAILGWKIFLLAYILSGLGSAGLDMLIQPDSFNYHLGASGAISGVMGMYAALFGLRKIQFFYNMLFWVGRVEAPAYIMLPIWLLKEAMQMAFVESNVNYLAHIGGLISGAIIATVLTRSNKHVDTDYMDEPRRKQQKAKSMSQGMQYLAEMKLDKAKFHFKQILKEYPNDIEVLSYLYNVCRHYPDDENYHLYSKQLIDACLADNRSELLFQTYQEYIKLAKPRPTLTYDIYFKIIDKLFEHQKIHDIEKLVLPLFKSNNKISHFSSIFLRLAKLKLAKGKKPEADKYANLIVMYFSEMPEASVARSILGEGQQRNEKTQEH